MNSLSSDHDTSPSPVIPESHGGNLWISPGVLLEEDPAQGLPSPDRDQCAVSDLSQWSGVRMGFNLLPYLLRAHEMAASMGCRQVHVANAGVGRLIREYGVDAAEELLTLISEHRSPLLPDQKKFLERILELERIRRAVVQAAIDILHIDPSQRGEVFGVTKKMTEDGAWRASFFNCFRRLKEDLEGNIDFYGDRLAFSSALERALPRRLRKKFARPPEQPLSPELQTELSKELDYLLEEGALAVAIMININQNDKYAVHKGADWVSDVPRRIKSHISTTDCLRVAVAGRIGNIADMGQAYRDSILNRWIVSEDLDGQGFFPRKGGTPEHMTPYYWYPGKGGNGNYDNGGGSEEIIMPFSPPLVPWEHGWWSRYANSGSGGIAPGQPSAVFASMIAPIMRHHLAHVMTMEDPTAHIELQTQYHSLQYAKLREWVERPDTAPLIPEGFTLKHVNDRIRAIAQEIGRRAWAIVNTSDVSASNAPSSPVPSSSGAAK